MRGFPHWRWHLDEAYVKSTAKCAISGGPWITKARSWSRSSPKSGKGRGAEISQESIKSYGRPKARRDGRASLYRAALQELGAEDLHGPGGRLNNRAENSHLPFDDGSGRCAGSNGRGRCKSSAPSTLSPQPFRSGAPPRQPPKIQTEALGRTDRVARPGGIKRRLRVGHVAQRIDKSALL